MSPHSISRQVVLASLPRGRLQTHNFRLEYDVMPELPPSGVLLRVLYLSLDPRLLGRMDGRKSVRNPVEVGEVMAGESVAEVIESDHPGYATGDIVLAPTGWLTHAASDGTGLHNLDPAFAPVTTALGVLGAPGFAAYAGLTLIGKPKPGETVVVAAASGPVGSLVGQLAKMAGARTVGIAGGPEKCRYLMDELGFDVAIDHRMPGLADELAGACPHGIDVYFESVGGAIWQAVLPLLNRLARVPVCGLIAEEGGAGAAKHPDLPMELMQEVLNKNLTLRGFSNDEFADPHYEQFLRTVSKGIADGRIHHREDITHGLENAAKAFIGVLEGRNFGKALVRVAA